MLIAGPSGSGKSILAGEFFTEGARAGETGVVAAFEQRPSKKRLNPRLANLIADESVSVINTGGPDLSVDEIHRTKARLYCLTHSPVSSLQLRRRFVKSLRSQCFDW